MELLSGRYGLVHIKYILSVNSAVSIDILFRLRHLTCVRAHELIDVKYILSVNSAVSIDIGGYHWFMKHEGTELIDLIGSDTNTVGPVVLELVTEGLSSKFLNHGNSFLDGTAKLTKKIGKYPLYAQEKTMLCFNTYN